MNNPMYEAQLNRHEEQIRDIDGRLHSYDLALRWCEGQIKKLAGDDYSPCVVCTEDKEVLKEHNDNQRKEINRLLKANEALKKEIQELKTKLGVVFAEKEKVRGDYERLRQDNTIEKEYDKLKGDHNLLKEAYKALENRYEREKVNWMGSIIEKNQKIASLEKGAKTQSDVIDQNNSEICYLKSELEKCKEACSMHQVNVNNFRNLYLEVKTENDRLNECLDKYCWKRVNNLEPLPFEDNESYLFIVDGYSNPVIGRYYGGDPSHIFALIDYGNGKGPQHKIFFFMDGRIRYWMPLPEMPDTAIK